MNRERMFEPWLLNANLDSTLSMWHKTPDSDQARKSMEILLKAAKTENLTVKIKREVLDKYTSNRAEIPKKAADYYSEVEGDSLVFKMGREIKARVGKIKSEVFLVFDTIHGEKFFFRPDDVVSLSVS